MAALGKKEKEHFSFLEICMIKTAKIAQTILFFN